MKPEDVSEEMIIAYHQAWHAAHTDPSAEPGAGRRAGIAAAFGVVERERSAALRLELRAIRREIAEINAVSGVGMRAAALTVLFNHEARAGMTGIINEPGITIKEQA